MHKNRAYFICMALLMAGAFFFILAGSGSGTSAAEKSSVNYTIETDVLPGGAATGESAHFKGETDTLGEAAQSGSGESTNYKAYGGHTQTQGTEPDDPTALNQYKSDLVTVIPTGEWISDDTVVFKFTMHDPDKSNDLTPQIELRITADAFNGTPNYSGFEVPFAGAPVTGIVTVPAISVGHSYHWRARIIDDEGRKSGWVSFGGNAETDADFITTLQDIVYISPTGNDYTGNGSYANPYRTIRKGLNSVAENGEVRMLSGTYNETGDYAVTWPDRQNIIMKRATEAATAVIVDAQSFDRVISVESSINLTMEGFTIRNGKVTGKNGGAVHLNAANIKLRLTTVTIESCTAESGDGGAIYSLNSTVSVDATNCTFYGNKAFKGGVASHGKWNVTNCDFNNNTASDNGGVSYNTSGDLWTVNGCTFKYNRGRYSGVNYGGNTWTINKSIFYHNSAEIDGGVFNWNPVTAYNCVFYHNEADGANGGVAAGAGTTLYNMTNCTFVGNSAAGFGGVMSNLYWGGSNNIFWYNTAGSDPVFNSLYSGSVNQYSDIQPDDWEYGTGNISIEPCFRSTVEANQYFLRLGSGSPCVDKGATNSLTDDLAGNPRPRGFDHDMGAYEFQGSSVRVDNPNGGETLYLGTSYEILWTTSPEADPNSVKIRLSTNEGKTWDTLVANNVPDVGIYTWEVTGGLSTECLISIEVTGNSLWHYDTSNATFTIDVTIFPPTNATAEALPAPPGTPTYVRIYWADSTGEAFEGYYIYRGLTFETYDPEPINSSLVIGTSFNDITVESGTDYYYAVKTYGYGLYSPYSNDASAPRMKMTRFVTVEAPVGGGYKGSTYDPVPGATIRYTIQYQNVGFAKALDIIINDKVPTYTDYKVGSATGEAANNVTFTQNNGSTWDYTPTGTVDQLVTNISWEVQDMSSGGSKLCTFEVVIE